MEDQDGKLSPMLINWLKDAKKEVSRQHFESYSRIVPKFQSGRQLAKYNKPKGKLKLIINRMLSFFSDECVCMSGGGGSNNLKGRRK
ncbi:hypothetical protein B0F90DRAFT_1773755 [Multifurca ochricompacta]|uniref:Uncharacterized protein n=1 Tax=Multifurca ochricompacta TaxID=376703 RepID=A0AAD4LW57_9AGAM|nr:hypothetical protein B0F90DRAFT_1773755 [Multifurca ochricompacta]